MIPPKIMASLKYWIVVMPIHILITTLTFIAVYALSVGGVNVGDLISRIPMSEQYMDKLASSDLGHVAIALLFLKLITPFRFAVTFTASTVAVKYFKNFGWIN